MFRHNALLVLIVCHGVIFAQEKKSTVEPPKPSAFVSFARQAVRENDATEVEVWLSTDNELEITSVTLGISSPDILEWYDSSCSQILANKSDIRLDSAGSKSAFHKKLCLKSKSNFTAGEYNVLFIFKYQWNKGTENRTAFMSIEKPLKLNLLGTDSLAGIPLALAGLIVPGFCFLLMLRAFKIIRTEGLDLMIHGVIVSLGFIGLAKVLHHFVAVRGWTSFAQKLHYLDASSNVSVDKLIWLSVSGAAVGGIVVLVYYSNLGIQKRRRQGLEIKDGDGHNTVLYKLLKRDARYNHFLLTLWLKDLFGSGNDSYRPMTVVRVKGGGEFTGTLGIKTGTSARLIGSFKVVINAATDQELANKLRRYKDKGWLLHVYRLATRKGLEIQAQNEVTSVADGSTTGNVVQVWDDDVTGIEFNKVGSGYQPLDVP
jgi:hypothetical protein